MSIFTNTNKQSVEEKGFTLIELIVVIAIIGLLASIVLTSLGLSRDRAEMTKFQSDYRAVSNALELYRQSNGGYPGTPLTPTSIDTLINGSLSSYMKQVPSTTSVAVSSQIPGVYYYLNSSDSNDTQYWCGDVNSTQDYVVYFTATQGAIDSGLFSKMVDNLGNETGYYCISVNQK